MSTNNRILPLFISVILFGCNPSYPSLDLVSEPQTTLVNSFPEYDSSFQNYTLDSLFAFLDEPEDTTFMIVEDLMDEFAPELTEDTEDSYWSKGRSAEIAGVESTDTTNLAVKVNLSTLDTLTQVLGVSDITFVWKGDTCSTIYFDLFLDNYDHSVDILEIKPQFLHTTLQLFQHGEPTEALITGDTYLKSVLYEVGLEEYVRYFKFRTETLKTIEENESAKPNN